MFIDVACTENTQMVSFIITTYNTVINKSLKTYSYVSKH